MSSLAFSSALDLAQQIRQKQLSPLEVTQFFLQRIQHLDSQLGSFVHIAVETAIATAQRQTEELAQCSDPSQLPPFFGVPIGIKDLNAVAGMPIGYGVAGLPEKIAQYDEGVITHLRQAGFILLGKTATSELGSFPYTETPGLPPTRNPWHLDYTPGGSSGGSAASVAAGLCPIALGSDGGGSIRGPASCCGLVGLKPSRGRVSLAPVGDYQSGIAVVGSLARTVADAAAFLDVVAGYTLGDPYWLPTPAKGFLHLSRQPLPKLRLAYAYGVPPFPPTDQAGQTGINRAIAVFQDLGYELTEACFDAEDLVEPFTKIWQAGVGASGIPPMLLSPVNRWLAETQGSAGDYLQAVRQMQITSRQIVAFFEKFDALVLPVYGHQPIRVGEWGSLSPAETLEKIIHWVSPCPPANATGLPAIAMPVGIDEQGLPIGVQIIGKPAAEGTILALAAQLEAAHLFQAELPSPFAV